MLKPALKKVMAGQALSADEMHAAVMSLIQGQADMLQIAALLVALRMKGETADEIVGAARAVRTGLVPVRAPEGIVVDTCGTGGDGAGSFNISTAVACVVAAGGVTVAKHGNRAVSSRSGSADVLEALGVPLEGDVAFLEALLQKHGIAFLFAPHLNTAMRAAAPLRAALGVRTLFNVLGPLMNPAAATHQLLGVFDPSLLQPMAYALKQLGTQAALVVHGYDGTDELSLCGPSHVALLNGGEVHMHTWTPQEVGLNPCTPQDLAGGDAVFNARLMAQLLQGSLMQQPLANAVAYNAGAVFWLVGKASTVVEGVQQAQGILRSGQGFLKIEAMKNRL